VNIVQAFAASKGRVAGLGSHYLEPPLTEPIVRIDAEPGALEDAGMNDWHLGIIPIAQPGGTVESSDELEIPRLDGPPEPVVLIAPYVHRSARRFAFNGADHALGIAAVDAHLGAGHE